MRFARHLLTVAIVTIAIYTAKGQKTSSLAKGYSSIFTMSSIDDPAANSVLAPHESPAAKIHANLFIKASASKTSCYTGEPILLTYQLYSSLQSTSTINRRPELFGFRVREVETYNESPPLVVYAGRHYRLFTVLQLLLTPFKEGPLTIDSLVVDNLVHYEDVSHNTIQYTGAVTSNPISILVKPLPLQAQPARFDGLVGTFTLKASMSSHNVPAGENDTLHVELSGRGELSGFSLPAIHWPAGVQYFEAKDKWTEEKNTFPPVQHKTFDIPFVATKPGRYTITVPGSCFFDPVAGIYRAGKAIDLALQADPALAVVAKPPAPAAAGRGNGRFYIITTGLLLLVVTMIFLVRFKRRNTSPPAIDPPPVDPVALAAMETRQRWTEIVSRLEAVKGITDASCFITEVKKLLADYCSFQFGAGTPSGEEGYDRIRLLSDQCNLWMYAPVALDSEARAALTAQLSGIILYSSPSLQGAIT